MIDLKRHLVLEHCLSDESGQLMSFMGSYDTPSFVLITSVTNILFSPPFSSRRNIRIHDLREYCSMLFIELTSLLVLCSRWKTYFSIFIFFTALLIQSLDLLNVWRSSPSCLSMAFLTMDSSRLTNSWFFTKSLITCTWVAIAANCLVVALVEVSLIIVRNCARDE